VQLNLVFLDDPDPPPSPWEQLDHQAQAAAIDILVRLTAAAVLTKTQREADDD
jgi:hypothetical protein